MDLDVNKTKNYYIIQKKSRKKKAKNKINKNMKFFIKEIKKSQNLLNPSKQLENKFNFSNFILIIIKKKFIKEMEQLYQLEHNILELLEVGSKSIGQTAALPSREKFQAIQEEYETKVKNNLFVLFVYNTLIYTNFLERFNR